jgi:hypothetical protein
LRTDRRCEPGLKDGRDVLGRSEVVGCHDARQQLLDVEMMRLGSPEYRSQRTERIRIDDAIDLVVREPAPADHGHPSIVLGSRRNRLE